MKISLIITTYNRPDALKKVFESLTIQTRLPDEVLIADDGSGPMTAEFISKISMQTPFQLVHVWQEDQGFRAARIRNEAIKKTSGDYIVLLDGDCVVPKRFIQDHIDLAREGFFSQGKRIVVSENFSPAFVREHANSTPKLIRLFLTGDISNAHHIFHIPWFPCLPSKSLKGIKSCNMAFFRNDIFAVNGFNEDFIGWGREDSELAIRFFNYGLRRRSHPFMAACFHLWHPELSRDRLHDNDDILERALTSNKYTCSNGLEKNKKQ